MTNILTNLEKRYTNKGIIYHTTITNIDGHNCQPTECDSRFYFIININNKKIKFYQSSEYLNAFSNNVPYSLCAFLSPLCFFWL